MFVARFMAWVPVINCV